MSTDAIVAQGTASLAYRRSSTTIVKANKLYRFATTFRPYQNLQ
jgi:hypothetical protein